MNKDDWEDTHTFLSRLDSETTAASVADIRRTKDILGEFTLRYFTEAIYGEEYARATLGESGGDIKLKDLKVEFSTKENGTFGTVVTKETMERILTEAHPSKSKEEIDRMIQQKPEANDAAVTAIEREVAKLDEHDRRVILEFMKNVNKDE